MKAAAADIGSNSCVLLIADRRDGVIRPLGHQMAVTRLGRKTTSGGFAQQAVEDTLATMRRFAQCCEAHGVPAQRRAAIGTAALRRVADPRLTRGCQEILGCPLEIVSADREASLCIRGVQTAVQLTVPTVVVDVGGGSTELILGCRRKLLRRPLSLDLGAVSMTERYLRADPPAGEALRCLQRCIEEQLLQVEPFSKVEAAIATGGAATTLARIHHRLDRHDSERVNNTVLNGEDIEQHLRRLSGMPISQRQRLAGLPPSRADIIVAGIAVLLGVVRHLGLKELRICDRGLRWGVIDELLQPRSA